MKRTSLLWLPTITSSEHTGQGELPEVAAPGADPALRVPQLYLSVCHHPANPTPRHLRSSVLADSDGPGSLRLEGGRMAPLPASRRRLCSPFPVAEEPTAFPGGTEAGVGWERRKTCRSAWALTALRIQNESSPRRGSERCSARQV